MKDSIIMDMKYADYDIIDGSPHAERHHVLSGSDRKKADEDGLWVSLSAEHHRTGPYAAHKCNVTKRLLQIIGQLAYELHYSVINNPQLQEEAHESFRRRYGKTYL